MSNKSNSFLDKLLEEKTKNPNLTTQEILKANIENNFLTTGDLFGIGKLPMSTSAIRDEITRQGFSEPEQLLTRQQIDNAIFEVKRNNPNASQSEIIEKTIAKIEEDTKKTKNLSEQFQLSRDLDKAIRSGDAEKTKDLTSELLMRTQPKTTNIKASAVGTDVDAGTDTDTVGTATNIGTDVDTDVGTGTGTDASIGTSASTGTSAATDAAKGIIVDDVNNITREERNFNKDKRIDPTQGILVSDIDGTEIPIPDPENDDKEDFKQKFIDQMPKFEGPTRFEKYMRFVDAGLKVAAGKSANAIENIAEGFKGLSKEFADDKQSERVFNNKIAQAAASYAINKQDKLDAEGRVLDNYFYVGQNPIEFNGRTYEKGDFIKLTRDQYDNFSGEVIPSTEFVNLQKEINALKKAEIEANQDLLKKLMPEKPKEISDAVGVYSEALQQANQKAEIVGMVRGLIHSVGQKNITGATPYIAKKYNQFLAFFGKDNVEEYNKNVNEFTTNYDDKQKEDFQKDINSLQKNYNLKENHEKFKNAYKYYDAEGNFNAKQFADNEKGTFNNLEKLGKEVQKYQTQTQIIANLMIRDLLGEGSKNISNIDRQLASEIVGLFSDAALTTVTQADLLLRLRNIEDRVAEGYDIALNKAATEERNYKNLYRTVADIKEGRSIFETDFVPLREKLLGKFSQAQAQAGGDISYEDFIKMREDKKRQSGDRS